AGDASGSGADGSSCCTDERRGRGDRYAGRNATSQPDFFYMSGTAECTTGSCTFQMDDSGYPGTVSKFVGEILLDDTNAFKISLYSDRGVCRTGQGSVTHTQIDRNIVMTDVVDGFLTQTELEGVGASGRTVEVLSAVFEIPIDYRAVALDTQGCAIGGAIHATNVDTWQHFDVEATARLAPPAASDGPRARLIMRAHGGL